MVTIIPWAETRVPISCGSGKGTASSGFVNAALLSVRSQVCSLLLQMFSCLYPCSTELPYSQTQELLWVAWQVGFWHAMCFREIKSWLSERHWNLAFCLLILLELKMWGKPPRLAWAYSSGYSHLSEETWDPFWNSFSCPQSQWLGLVLSQGTIQSPSLSVIRIIMLVLNPEETIWRTRQEKLCGLNPSLIQDTKWFKTSLGAKECIGVLVALATCLLAGMRGRQRGLEGAALLSETTGLPQTASEDGHHSEQVDWHVHDSLKVLLQIRAVGFTELSGSGLGCCPVPWLNRNFTGDRCNHIHVPFKICWDGLSLHMWRQGR